MMKTGPKQQRSGGQENREAAVQKIQRFPKTGLEKHPSGAATRQILVRRPKALQISSKRRALGRTGAKKLPAVLQKDHRVDWSRLSDRALRRALGYGPLNCPEKAEFEAGQKAAAQARNLAARVRQNAKTQKSAAATQKAKAHKATNVGVGSASNSPPSKGENKEPPSRPSLSYRLGYRLAPVKKRGDRQGRERAALQGKRGGL